MDIHRNDGMYSISKEWTMLQTNIAIWQKDQYNRMNKQASLPRLLWVKKENTLKELHLNVFKHLRYAFAEWADWSDPNSDKQGKEGRSNLRNIIPFPYKLQDDQPMTKARFMALSDEEAFNMCFKGVVEGEQDNRGQGSHNFMIER